MCETAMQEHVCEQLKHIKVVSQRKVQSEPFGQVDAARAQYSLHQVAQHID